jgi:hypothetical protein
MSAGGGGVMDLIGEEKQDPPTIPLMKTAEENDASDDDREICFEDRMRELEDMGGDSFFLSDGDTIDPADSCDEEEEEDPVLSSEAFMAIAMSAGGGGVMDLIGEEKQDPPTLPLTGDGILDMIGKGAEKASTEEDDDENDWEWDGIVDEEAHLGFD